MRCSGAHARLYRAARARRKCGAATLVRACVCACTRVDVLVRARACARACTHARALARARACVRAARGARRTAGGAEGGVGEEAGVEAAVAAVQVRACGPRAKSVCVCVCVCV